MPDCKKSSLVYENICLECNPGAGAAKEPEEVRTDEPTLYVGETSRSLYERSKEHWGSWKTQKSDSHILRHQETVHNGAGKPNFVMRAIKYYRTALSRQIGEACRIRRRGGQGNILNSKSEYDRCRIPRLIVEEQDMEKLNRIDEQELQETLAELDEQ